MSRFIKILIAIAVLFAFSACGPEQKIEDISENAAQTTPEPAGTVSPEASPAYEVRHERETGHFIIRYFSRDFTEADRECVDRIEDALETGQSVLAERFRVTFPDKKIVEIHKDHKELHIAMGHPEAPDGFCGGYGYGKIMSASPLLPTPHTDYEGLIRTPLHEYVHLVLIEINPFTPRWLNEGIAFYESNDGQIENVGRVISAGVLSGSVPTFEKLDTGEDYQSFAYMRGYEYMYTFIEFLVGEYGYEKLNALIRRPDDFEGAFGYSQDVVREQWLDFLEENYSGN